MDYEIKIGALGRWIIVNAENDNLAWSGSRWTGHYHGIPTGDVQVCNFTTEAEALAYVQKLDTSTERVEKQPESRQVAAPIAPAAEGEIDLAQPAPEARRGAKNG